ncbi:hypothetical protein SO802_009528 [Lithocarpus litseifolius]|uniref:Uncharacterized protein n=1 Tax=Lithocarpus litseifolius TaxID=425828 RepID=A0AAW2DG02_9ROSI
MEKESKITQYRERLDKTLASPDLKNGERLKTLVKDQLLHSTKDETKGLNEKVIEKRTAEVSNFLDMLRSTSVNDNEGLKASEKSHAEWKLKQDNEEYRVLYREGPQGTPFHSLLVEGYVEGPVDVCLCISCESSLYKKWWPQSTIPTFKIISCKCLQRVRIGEQISLVRMKLSWPLSSREAVVHYFLVEDFQDDLIVVLLNTISDSEDIDMVTHGFTGEAIPEAEDVVRIDVVGGYALQKVTPERSYFRTIATMDIKLDFVPPSLINFISRQLIGNGFRLYQKRDQVGVQSMEMLKVRASLEERLKQEGILSSRASKSDKAQKRLKPVNGIAIEANLPSVQLSALENMHYSHMIRFDNVEEAR